MADEYDKNRAFGKPENIEKRLAMWARQFAMDKSYPWVGLGVIDDLRQACRMLGGDPDQVFPDLRPKSIFDAKPTEQAAAPVPAAQEYDL